MKMIISKRTLVLLAAVMLFCLAGCSSQEEMVEQGPKNIRDVTEKVSQEYKDAGKKYLNEWPEGKGVSELYVFEDSEITGVLSGKWKDTTYYEFYNQDVFKDKDSTYFIFNEDGSFEIIKGYFTRKWEDLSGFWSYKNGVLTITDCDGVGETSAFDSEANTYLLLYLDETHIAMNEHFQRGGFVVEHLLEKVD